MGSVPPPSTITTCFCCLVGATAPFLTLLLSAGALLPRTLLSWRERGGAYSTVTPPLLTTLQFSVYTARTSLDPPGHCLLSHCHLSHPVPVLQTRRQTPLALWYRKQAQEFFLSPSERMQYTMDGTSRPETPTPHRPEGRTPNPPKKNQPRTTKRGKEKPTPQEQVTPTTQPRTKKHYLSFFPRGESPPTQGTPTSSRSLVLIYQSVSQKRFTTQHKQQ